MRKRIATVVLAIAVVPSVLFAKDAAIKTSRKDAKELKAPSPDDSFSFIVFGDRTTGEGGGLNILRQAVREVNLIGADLVFTVGDMVQGDNTRGPWLKQMKQYRGIMDALAVPWYPVAGNHDIYWRGGGKPPEEHESDFESHFGPLWYSLRHKNCLFIALHTEEGNPKTGRRSYHSASGQIMSDRQKQWLRKTLRENRDARHVFMFQHHPRWQGDSNTRAATYGRDWENVHAMLKAAGNVSALFGGHTHCLKFGGRRAGIAHYTMGVTGAGRDVRAGWRQGQGHQYALVTVQGGKCHVAMIPVGYVFDPEKPRLPSRERELVKATGHSFATKETRSVEYPLVIPALESPRMVLRVSIHNSYDDSADHGMTYKVLDEDGNKIGGSFLSTHNWSSGELEVQPGDRVRLILEDLDTSHGGRTPGNGIKVQVTLYY